MNGSAYLHGIIITLQDNINTFIERIYIYLFFCLWQSLYNTSSKPKKNNNITTI